MGRTVRRSHLLRNVLLSVLALTWAAAGASLIADRMRPDRNAIHAMLSTELPFGTSSARVIAWLDRHGIEHAVEGDPPVAISAIFRHTRGTDFLFDNAVHAEFTFHERRLASVVLNDIITGP